jgi:hypothetical protein
MPVDFLCLIVTRPFIDGVVAAGLLPHLRKVLDDDSELRETIGVSTIYDRVLALLVLITDESIPIRLIFFPAFLMFAVNAALLGCSEWTSQQPTR